jgi:hypothetical protein
VRLNDEVAQSQQPRPDRLPDVEIVAPEEDGLAEDGKPQALQLRTLEPIRTFSDGIPFC